MRFLFLLVGVFTVNALVAQDVPPPPPPVVGVDTSSTEIFQKVEVEASVDAKLWVKNLSLVLQPYIEKAAKKGMKPGTYTVQVRFLVERDGSIGDVQALNDPGYNLGKGAVKAVRSGPKWTPGEVSGRKVRSYHTQPITFVIQEG